jgi:hypothetical protein
MLFESAGTRAIPWLIVCALAMPHCAAQSIVATPAGLVATADQQQRFTQQELDRMLAPIALYPDGLLSQMLMASTYPVEVEEAAQWQQVHPGLSATALHDALATETWDPSVKSLCAFSGVLDRMSTDPAWTQDLGDAFIAQQAAVMDTIQSLRGKARAAGTLVSNAEQIVNVDDDLIAIVPRDPQTVYVPTYDPSLVYGSWWWPDDPPYYPEYWGGTGNLFPDGFYWGAGVAVGPGLWGVFDWRQHRVDIDLNRYHHFYGDHVSDGHWRFDPEHRFGVPYRNAGLEGGYGHEGREIRREAGIERGRSFEGIGAHLEDAELRGGGMERAGGFHEGEHFDGEHFSGGHIGGAHVGGGGHGGGGRR